MSIAVESNIPLPSERTKRYPYKEMELGECFFVPESKIQLICNANYKAQKRTGMKFTARREGNGVRVWRIE